MPQKVPLLVSFLGKLVLEVLPAALASVIGAFVFAQYQFGHPATPAPVAEQASPASAAMIQMVRDEHAMIVSFLQTQRAAEEIQLAVSRDDAVASTNPQPAPVPARRMAALATVKPATARHKTSRLAVVAAAAPRAPLVVARLELDHNATLAKPTARRPNSLVARSLAIKDGVISATWHMVSAIGGLPSWIASVGDRPAPRA